MPSAPTPMNMSPVRKSLLSPRATFIRASDVSACNGLVCTCIPPGVDRPCPNGRTAIIGGRPPGRPLGKTLTRVARIFGAERGLNELGNVADVHLLHRPRAVRFDGLDADVQRLGDLFVLQS